MAITLTLSILFLAGVFILLRMRTYYNQKREFQLLLLQTIITFIVTFSGVFLASQLNTYQDNRKERIKFALEIEQWSKDASTLCTRMINCVQDVQDFVIVKKILTNQQASIGVLQRVDMDQPDRFIETMSAPSFKYHFEAAGWSCIHNTCIGLINVGRLIHKIKHANLVEDADIGLAEISNPMLAMSYYALYWEIMAAILTTETEYQNRRISKQMYRKRMQEHYDAEVSTRNKFAEDYGKIVSFHNYDQLPDHMQ